MAIGSACSALKYLYLVASTTALCRIPRYLLLPTNPQPGIGTWPPRRDWGRQCCCHSASRPHPRWTVSGRAIRRWGAGQCPPALSCKSCMSSQPDAADLLTSGLPGHSGHSGSSSARWEQTVDVVASSLADVLHDGSFASGAKGLAREMTAMPDAAVAACHLERWQAGCPR